MSKTTERTEAIERLRPYLPVGTTVYTSVHSVSRSGMSRTISCHLLLTDEYGRPYPWNITWLVARILDCRLDDAGNLRVPGVGMDMTFHVVYGLSSAMFPEGHHCTGSATGKTPTGRPSKALRCPSNDHANDYGMLARKYDAQQGQEFPTAPRYLDSDSAYVSARQAWIAAQPTYSRSRVHSDGGYALNRGHL